MIDSRTDPIALTPPAPPLAYHPLPVSFTGSGSEYFRIWAVNLLLILATLGLYIPFAKARRIRYFYANTLVGGHALGFHGDPWKMFRGFILLAVLMGLYSAVGQLAPAAAFPAFLLLCAIWPALWRASMQFRLGNTSWRGLRLRFTGSLTDAYLACAPVYVPIIVMVAISTLMAPELTGDKDTDAVAQWEVAKLTVPPMLLALLLAPWSLALTKRFQHNGYRIASEQGQIDLPIRKLYVLGLKTVLMSLTPVLVVVGVSVVVSMLLGKAGAALVTLMVLGGYLLLFAVVMPFAAARLQNLVWNRTRTRSLTFRSSLRFRSLFWLTLKNWTLTALTLGFYRPFAAVNTAKLRLEALRLESSTDPADWIGPGVRAQADATGEVAGDFFGIDMGL